MDIDKLYWMNGEYLRHMPQDDYKKAFCSEIKRNNFDESLIDDSYLQRVTELMHERIKILPEINTLAGFFFSEEFAYDEKAINKRIKKDGAINHLMLARDRFSVMSSFDAESCEIADKGYSRRKQHRSGPAYSSNPCGCVWVDYGSIFI